MTGSCRQKHTILGRERSSLGQDSRVPRYDTFFDRSSGYDTKISFSECEGPERKEQVASRNRQLQERGDGEHAILCPDNRVPRYDTFFDVTNGFDCITTNFILTVSFSNERFRLRAVKPCYGREHPVPDRNSRVPRYITSSNYSSGSSSERTVFIRNVRFLNGICQMRAAAPRSMSEVTCFKI